jgi:hypothetical protein
MDSDNLHRFVTRAAATIAGFLHVFAMQSAGAHHAPTEFDFANVIEIEGTIVEVKWQNPHVAFKVRAHGAQGQPVIWEIEGSSVSMLRRTNAAAERLQVRDKVRIAGNPSRRATNKLYGLNLLHANGREIVFHPEGRQRWQGVAVGNVSTWFDGNVESSRAGIFRVWSTKFDDSWLSAVPPERLNDAARAKVAAWDLVHDSATHGCEPVGMPVIMAQPYPIEFVQQKDRILLRIELYDLVRTIHMSDAVARGSLPTHILGRSKGRWEGNTLIVETDGITWPYLDYMGMPLSTAASLVERFTATDDGTRLNYSVIITDPQYLTEPVELQRSWVARPNEAVKRYDCGAQAPATLN